MDFFFEQEEQLRTLLNRCGRGSRLPEKRSSLGKSSVLRVLNIIDPRLHRSKQGQLVMQSCIWPLHPMEEPLSQAFVGLGKTISVLQVRRCPSHPTRDCFTDAAQADQGPLFCTGTVLLGDGVV